MKCLAVVMAMAAEASPVLTGLGARSSASDRRFPVRWFEVERSGCNVVIAVNGRDRRHGVDSVGTEPAVVTTMLTLDRYEPDLIISAGTAGGYQRHGAAIGDVFVSDDRFVRHDRRIGITEFAEYAIGSHAAAPVGELASALSLKTGMVTTGNSLEESDDERRIIEASGAAVKEMEAAAIAYVCENAGVPMFALKAITDLVDHHAATAEQFSENLAMASRRLADSLIRVIDFCAIRTVKDLG